jgi:hypothetical protein
MKILRVITIATMAAASVWATETPAANRRITVCLELGNHQFVLSRAKTIAEGMFAAIGVKIDWQRYPACPQEAIRIDFSENTYSLLFPQAYAYALPTKGLTSRYFSTDYKNEAIQSGYRLCWLMCWYTKSVICCRAPPGIRRAA